MCLFSALPGNPAGISYLHIPANQHLAISKPNLMFLFTVFLVAEGRC